MDIKEHPNYYDWSEYEDYEGAPEECIRELCDEFPYVTEAIAGFPIDWFFENIHNRFTFVSKNAYTMSVFFDDLEEVKQFHEAHGIKKTNKQENPSPKKKKRRKKKSDD